MWQGRGRCCATGLPGRPELLLASGAASASADVCTVKLEVDSLRSRLTCSHHHTSPVAAAVAAALGAGTMRTALDGGAGA